MKTKRDDSERAYVAAAIAHVVKALNEEEGVYFEFGKFVEKESGGRLRGAQIATRLAHVLDGSQGPSAFMTVALLRFGERRHKGAKRKPAR